MKHAKRLMIQIFIILGIVAVFLLIFFLFRSKKTAEVPETVTPVQVINAAYGTLENTLTLTGFVSSEQMASVTPKVQGTMTELTVDLGDQVTAGQIIARIDSEPYRIQLSQAQAAYQAAESTWKRVASLYESGSVTKQVYDQTKAQYDAVTAQLRMARLQLSYTGVTAPVSGTVMVVHTRPGNGVSLTTPIVTIGEVTRNKVALNVPEQYFSEIAALFAGAQRTDVKFSIPSMQNYKTTGTITAVAPYISPASRTFEVTCVIDDKNTPIRPGMLARVTIVLQRQDDVHWLPYSALSGENLWIEQDGHAKKISYTPKFEGSEGFRIPDEYAVYHFIVEGQHFLKDGAPVRVTQEK